MKDQAKVEGLLIVHLSSLDSYTDALGQSAGERLASELVCAIKRYQGPVFVTDQEWEFIGKQCWPRRAVEEALRNHPQVVRFFHDESIDEWDEAMQRLGDLLRSSGMTHLIIGGTWASSDDAEGCVNETRRLLEQQGFVCQISEKICGMVED